jgi:hypothetical protein
MMGLKEFRFRPVGSLAPIDFLERRLRTRRASLVRFREFRTDRLRNTGFLRELGVLGHCGHEPLLSWGFGRHQGLLLGNSRVFRNAVQLLLDPIEAVHQLLHIRTEFGTRDVFARNLFPGTVEQNTEPVQFRELLVHDVRQHAEEDGEDRVPEHHFHDVAHFFRLPEGLTGHDCRAGLVFFAAIVVFSVLVSFFAAFAGRQAG